MIEEMQTVLCHVVMHSVNATSKPCEGKNFMHDLKCGTSPYNKVSIISYTPCKEIRDLHNQVRRGIFLGKCK